MKLVSQRVRLSFKSSLEKTYKIFVAILAFAETKIPNFLVESSCQLSTSTKSWESQAKN